MFWLISAGIGVAIVSAIISTLENESGTQRHRWEEKHQQTQHKITVHRQNITAHLQTAQRHYDFQALVSAHFTSMQTANEAYLLLNDATKSIAAVNTALNTAKQQMSQLQQQQKTADPQLRQYLCTDIDNLRQLRQTLFVQKNTLVQQKQQFLAEVKQLNNQTHALKERIRLETGWRGEAWYQKLEMRKTQRRLTQRRLTMT